MSVACFGSLTLYQDGSVVYIANKKAGELLALLLAEGGKPIRKTLAAETLWPDSDPGHAMDSLYKVCAALRRVNPGGESLPLHVHRDTLWLDAGGLDSDIARFRCLYRDREEITCCLAAIELYTAPFLINECYEWSAPAEAYYDVRYLELVSVAERYFSALGDEVSAAYYRCLAST